MKNLKKSGFCENKLRSMLISGTFAMAIIYVMLLCDSIIAGLFIGENGVAAINAINPITGITTFFASIISIGTGILYSKSIGEANRKHADELFGQGMILSVAIAVFCSIILLLGKDLYFDVNGVTGDIYELASDYYKWTPVCAVFTILNSYICNLVYTDGDETCINISYALRIVGNIAFSIILARSLGMQGIILGTIASNVLGLIPAIAHFFRKCNTLRFTWHLSLRDIIQTIRFSAVDAVIYICWAIADYILIAYVSGHYGENGLITLAVVISLIEFGVVMDGVGMAVQPLLGTYLGEDNNIMIKRLMKTAKLAAFIEGVFANLIIMLFAKQFCALFGIKDGLALEPTILAVRIVSFGMIFCSMVSLMTSYYMMVNRVGLAVGVTFLKDGLFYSALPIAGSLLLGKTGMWTTFAISPILALIVTSIFIRLYYGKENFPSLLVTEHAEVVVFDDILSPEKCSELSEKVQKTMTEHGYSKKQSMMAALFTEEIGLTIIEKNKDNKNTMLVELSLLFDKESVLLIERDAGKVFDITDPDMKIEGLSSFILSGLMEAHKEKAYQTTTGYNRNIIRFYNKEA